MDNFNKIISFILGLVVVVVFLAVVTGKLNLRKNISFLTRSATSSAKETPTPTPTPTPISTVKISPVSSSQQINRYQKQSSQIPATGSPTIILSFLVGGASMGFFLRRVKPGDF